MPQLGGRDGGSVRVHRDRYELLFVLLLLAFLLGAFFSARWARLPTLLFYVAALLLALRSSRLPGQVSRIARVLLAVGSILVGIGVVVAPTDAVQGALACWVAIVVLSTIVVVVRRILTHPTVTMQTVFGALSVYLLIGFFFASVYTATARLGTAPFFAGGQQATSSTVQYFSFVTLTTTGYGDYTAAGDGGRALAVLEALLGQIFLVTLVARLVSMFGRGRSIYPSSASQGGEAEELSEPLATSSLAPDEAPADVSGRVWRRPSSRERQP